MVEIDPNEVWKGSRFHASFYSIWGTVFGAEIEGSARPEGAKTLVFTTYYRCRARCGESQFGLIFGAEKIPKEKLKSDKKSKRRRPRGLPDKVHFFMSVYVDFGSKMGSKMEASSANKMINIWTPNMILTDSNHVGTFFFKPCDPPPCGGPGRR